MKPSNPPIRDWRGRTVWVLGASSGIGQATAEHLARAGARVIVSARRPDPLAQFCIRHPTAQALPLDIDDAPQLEASVAMLRHRLGHVPLDLVVYCIGHYRPVRAWAFDLPEMLRHQQINYVGALRTLHHVLPILLAQGQGHISLVASVAGYRGLPRALAYGPTKAALISLAQTLYQELRPRGIGVSVINPGFVATPLTVQNDFDMPALQTPDQAAQAILAGWAAGRFDIDFPRRFSRAIRALALLGLISDRLAFALTQRLTNQGAER